MNFIGIIPARFASTRFPGKPLIDIHGKTMIQRVYQQVKLSKSLSEVVVATDDKRIFDHVHSFGGNVLMTASHHVNGTERCCEVIDMLEKLNTNYDIAINIQGDEPFIDPEQIDKVASCFLNNSSADIATLIKKLDKEADLLNPSIIKVVKDINNKALYFSRSPIPFYRDGDWAKALLKHTYYKHIGIYAYRTEILKKITVLNPSSLELSESLEQLRWLQNGFSIFTELTNHESRSIDTPQDLLTIN